MDTRVDYWCYHMTLVIHMFNNMFMFAFDVCGVFIDVVTLPSCMLNEKNNHHMRFNAFRNVIMQIILHQNFYWPLLSNLGPYLFHISYYVKFPYEINIICKVLYIALFNCMVVFQSTFNIWLGRLFTYTNLSNSWCFKGPNNYLQIVKGSNFSASWQIMLVTCEQLDDEIKNLSWNQFINKNASIGLLWVSLYLKHMPWECF